MQITEHLNIKHPIIGGPMYPCSNPELVAALSQAGAMGVIQPLTLTYVNGYDFKEGLEYIKSLTDKPLGFNALIESSSKTYENKMRTWIDSALESGIRFFITSLGNPSWVVEKVHAYGGLVYHDATEERWAEVACKAGVDGLIAVNNEAGGHAGIYDAKELFQRLQGFGLPLVCAGGIGDKKAYNTALKLGYSGVQMGTRFIASDECDVSKAYKEAIIESAKEDIILTKNLTGVNVSVIKPTTTLVTKNSKLFDWGLKHPWVKKYLRMFLALKSLYYLKKSRTSDAKGQLWQAGKSVEGIKSIKSVKEIIDSLM